MEGATVEGRALVEPEERKRLATLVRYLVRAPLTLRNLTYDQATGQVLRINEVAVRPGWEPV